MKTKADILNYRGVGISWFQEKFENWRDITSVDQPDKKQCWYMVGYYDPPNDINVLGYILSVCI